MTVVAIFTSLLQTASSGQSFSSVACSSSLTARHRPELSQSQHSLRESQVGKGPALVGEVLSYSFPGVDIAVILESYLDCRGTKTSLSSCCLHRGHRQSPWSWVRMHRFPRRGQMFAFLLCFVQRQATLALNICFIPLKCVLSAACFYPSLSTLSRSQHPPQLAITAFKQRPSYLLRVRRGSAGRSAGPY